MQRDIEHRAAFESQGETYVRKLAAKGGDIGADASAWLAEQQSIRDAEVASIRDAREEETLRIARRANRIAWIAAAIAAISIIKDIAVAVFM